MARGATIVVENSFTQGLITEASAMNFPENAVTEAENVVFSELGKVTRRDGIDFEPNHQNLIFSLTYSGVFNEFKWDAVGGRGDRSFIVQQIGSLIRFYEESDGAISTGLKPFVINLVNYKTAVADSEISNNDCQFAFGKGYLFVTHPMCNPLAVSYNDESDSITINIIDIRVRDFERLDDGYEIDFRPFDLSDLHYYNLLNQGWYYHAIVKGSSSPRNVLSAWDEQRSDYPSNADIWWIYKGATEVANFKNNQDGDTDVTPAQVTMGNTPAPNGHYIYSAWNINRSAETGIVNLPVRSSGVARPSCVTFFAGRVFYAGVSSNGYSDQVYFTQIIESDDQFGKCYQVNDPTSETVFDLLASDGGTISLPLVSKVTSLQVVGDALIVIGTNGVFAIRGSDNGPFRATDYTIEYISEVGTSSRTSIVNVDNSLIFWNYDAIYALSKDQIGISFQVQNISKPTIQKVVDSILPQNKAKIKAAYNKRERVVQWMYSTNPDTPGVYDKILELNVISKAFYLHTLPTSINAPKIVGLISISGGRRQILPEPVIDNLGNIVTDNSGATVQISSYTIVPNSEIFKYSTLVTPTKLTFSDPVQEHVDWGVYEFNSHFVSGYRIRGELLRPFQSSPIAVSLENIEDGEAIIKGIWDYGSRVTTPQWLYLRGSDLGDYFTRRVKLRGKGRSFQIRFDSEGSRPFSIIGWSTFDTGGQQP